MLKKPGLAISIAILALAMSACASTIGNVSNLDEAAFQIGTTHKNEVADLLGFPASRETDSGVEYWGYRETPELTGLIYALPTSSTTVTTYSATKPYSGPIRMDSVAVIYTFNEAGVLIDVFESDQD